MKQKGFTLIELSIVLIIVSILIGGGAALSLSQIEKFRYDTTLARLDIIEEALTQFLSLNGRLPCPADNAIPSSHPLYGFEQTASTPGAPQTCSATNLLTIPSGTYEVPYGGAVPFKTLGLSNDFMLDGWNNKILYTTIRSLVNNQITNSSCLTSNYAQNGHSNPSYICFRVKINSLVFIFRYISTPSVTAVTDAAYTLVSAGANGFGAYRNTASGLAIKNPDSTSPNEIENFDGNYGFVLSGYQKSASIYTLNQFDDIVRFKARNLLVYECNQKYDLACTNTWGIDLR
ncbi:prepilin-type N-terminal cleavage/methylation domain-containing protein [endosymbiont of Acanthamoeba sp. UWC8]|uniref:type II secretion system protein n=1 Tax=endosymbiont of Acanthamoeba sp. UWC8 TaxID=86106 RepID=UPI0004D0E167|nr:prepilin-type N-terminal cleavage/methylation domain-containing protein [endosymbiont of Acanthamoeba sp. UWC8]AIF81864.1 prepilin-type N-terminal cleavage/methylation domain-containing protein [endosymbiont of Acanthamoeba sp. UWC8]